MEVCSIRGASSPKVGKYMEQPKFLDDLCVHSTAASNNSAGDRIANRNLSNNEPQHHALPESSSAPTNRFSINRRLSTLYKPLKRVFNSVDLKSGGESTDQKEHNRNRPKSASFSSPVCSFQDNNKTQWGKSSPSLRRLKNVSSFNFSGSLKSSTAVPFLTVGDLSTAGASNTTGEDPFSSASFSSSITVVEGMHQLLDTPIVPGGHKRNYTMDDRSSGSYTPRSSLHSRFSSMASFGSNRSRKLSFTRPLSGFLNKSADRTDLLFVDRRISLSSIDGEEGVRTDGWNTSRSTLSANGTFDCKVLGADAREQGVKSSGKKSWSKFLNGYTSPIKRYPSPLFTRSRVTKTVASTSPTSPASPMTQPEERICPDLTHPSKLYTTIESRPRPQEDILPSQDVVTTPNCVAVEVGAYTGFAVSRSKLPSFVASTILQLLLFCICPPYELIKAGGTGMLVVYGVLMVSLACISWMVFNNEREDAKAP